VRLLIPLLSIVVALALLHSTSKAQSPDTSCVEDPTLNHIIDTADIQQFTSRFGLAAAPFPQLDIKPLLGNGYIDTGDLASVTSHFGETCWGGSAALTPPGDSPPNEETVYGCMSKMAVYQYVMWETGVVIQNWGGEFGCWMNAANGPYVPECFFEFKQGTETVAITPQAQGHSEDGNKVVCQSQGDISLLPCTNTIGWAWVGVRQGSENGPWVFGPREDFLVGSGGFGFNPCS